MNNAFIEIAIIFLLLLANGVFAMAEMAVVASRKTRLHQRSEKGERGAQQALSLANNPHEFLSAIQIGITLIGIFAGVFGGATIAEEIDAVIRNIPLVEPYSEAIAFGVVVVVITYFSLVIGELVPKRLALNNPEQIAISLATRIQLLANITRPINRFLGLSAGIVIRLLGVRPSIEPQVTEEEIRLLIEQGTQIGIFEVEEQEMIAGVLRLGDRRIDAYMTPRPQIVWLHLDDTPDEIRRIVNESGYSKFPVLDNGEDTVIGVVNTKDLLVQSLSNQQVDLKSALYPPLYVPKNTLALGLLELFKHKSTHMAIVIDEYGGIQGIITHQDLIEGIVGDIPSTDQPEAPEIFQRADGSWLLDGLLHIDKLKEISRTAKLPGEEEARYQTIGGFVMTQLNKIPAVGDTFDWGQFRFEVVDMDGHRVDKVLVIPL